MPRTKKTTGPEPTTLKIDGNWEAEMMKAMRKPKPAGGWPKSVTKPKRKKRKKTR